jgi:hypothetical protein
LLHRYAFPVLLFVVAVVPRAVRPVSRPLVWYLRSAHFIEAVLARNWASTVYSEHPGVTLMWPAGIGLKIYWALSGVAPAARTVPPDFEPIHFSGPVPLSELSAALFPLALLIALGVTAVYPLLRRLFDTATAAVAGLILALSPYFLAQSKVLHLDALMALLMLLSALALLIYRRERKRRWLVLSGALGGLALLTKTPALFLLPFGGLVFMTDILRTWKDSPKNVTHSVRRLVLALLAWCLVASGLYVILWPVMWVDPGAGLVAVKWGVTRHAATAHDSPTLFLGDVVREDPGPLFYGVALLFRTSEVELTFLAVGMILALAYLLRHLWSSQRGTDYGLLFAYALFFIAAMCLGAKKMPRYVLPAMLSLDILAAAGIVAWARRLGSDRHRLELALMALPVIVQAVLILPRHPYYGTALNWLAGGPPAAARAMLIGEEGEGYSELTAHLNTDPAAESLVAGAQLKHVFNQTFVGKTVEIDERPADYLAFHRNYTARDYKIDQWGSLWERYAPRTPELEITFDGVPYAWLYPSVRLNPTPEHLHTIRFADGFRFLGYDLRSCRVEPGDGVPLVLYWQVEESVSADLSIFVHLLTPDGELIWQDDGAAAHGERPTWSWEPGETVVDPHTVSLPSDLPGGEYLLTTGLYDWRTGERVPIPGQQEGELSGDQLRVEVLTVRHPPVPIQVWVARALSSLILISAAGSVVRPIWNRSRKPLPEAR